MASQAPPNGPGRGASQLYPVTSVFGRESQVPPVDTPACGVSQLYPSGSLSHAQTIRAPSKAPSSAIVSQSRQPLVRPSQAPPNQPSVRPSQAPYNQPTIRPSHNATFRGVSQAPSHHPSIRPSHAAILRGLSQAAPAYGSTHDESQYHTALSQVPGREPTMRAEKVATELRRDPSSQLTVVLQSPSNNQTLLQRDVDTDTQRQSAQPTLLQRDQSKIPSSMSIMKEASIKPIIGPSKKFENLPCVRSILNSPADIQMASRQSVINELQGPEREAQEEWALGKLGKLDTGCPQNYGWTRRDDGYICDGGSHYITDLLLTEGMGGMFVVKNKHDWEDRSQGPYYWAGKNEQGKNLFMKIKDPKME